MAKAATGSSGKSAPAKARTAPRSTARRKRRSQEGTYSLGREVFGTAMGCLWIILGLGIVAVSAGIYYGTTVAIDVLHEIGQRDFSGPRERINQYEQYFNSLDSQQYSVQQGKTNILEGVVSYMWTVEPRGSLARRRFEWFQLYEGNEIQPKTNPALCLDVQLGYMTEGQAAAYTGFAGQHERYDPDDVITQSIVQNRFSLIQPQDLSGGWEAVIPPEGPVGAPVVSPTEGNERQETAEQVEEPQPEEGSETSPNEATEVVGEEDEGDGSAGDEGDGATPIEGSN